MAREQIIAMLLAERDKIDRAIQALEGPKRRGRPPKSPLAASATMAEGEPRKRRTMSAANRKAQAERMRLYWANKRKASR